MREYRKYVNYADRRSGSDSDKTPVKVRKEILKYHPDTVRTFHFVWLGCLLILASLWPSSSPSIPFARTSVLIESSTTDIVPTMI